MSKPKRDVLDPELARRLAWRTSADLADELPPAPLVADPFDDEDDDEDDDEEEEKPAVDEQTRWALARRRGAEMVVEIRRIAALPEDEQVEALAALLERAHADMDATICARERADETIRFWQLVVRHFDDLVERAGGGDDHLIALIPLRLPLHRAEAAAILEEITARRLDDLIDTLGYVMKDRDKDPPRHPAVDEAVARIIDRGETWAVRAAAARWLSEKRFEPAVPALRRALGWPCLPLRARALSLLARAGALTADEVQALLDEAAERALSGDMGRAQQEAGEAYAEALRAAVLATRPPRGARPLEEIATWDHLRVEGPFGWTSAWAYATLATAYPERARWVMGRALRARFTRWASGLVEAIGTLPEEAARPLLLEAAGHPPPYRAEEARRVWFRRFGEECPVGELGAVPRSLLAGPPSDRLVAGAVILRGRSDEASGRLLHALLAEGPGRGVRSIEELTPGQREALALWTFAARDVPLHAGLPFGPGQVAAALADRFGGAAIPALAILAEEDAEVGIDHEWLTALSTLLGPAPTPLQTENRWLVLEAEVRLPLGDAERALLRRLGERGLASAGWDGSTAPLVALKTAGARPEDVDAMLAVLAHPSAGDPDFRAARWVQWNLDGAPGVDDKLAAAARAAWEARDHAAFARIAQVGCMRDNPAVVQLFTEAVDALAQHPEATSALRSAVLRGRSLDTAWALARLRDPASPAFDLGWRLVKDRPEPEVLEALLPALRSSARGGAPAARAAGVLGYHSARLISNELVDELLTRAPVDACADALALLVRRGVPIAELRAHLIRCIAAGDFPEIGQLLDMLWHHRPAGAKEVYRAALPLVRSPGVGRFLQRELGRKGHEAPYWQALGEEAPATEVE